MAGYRVTAPAKGGISFLHEDRARIRKAAAAFVGCDLADMIEVDSPDGATTYCYASQDEADSDRDGAYAVQYREME